MCVEERSRAVVRRAVSPVADMLGRKGCAHRRFWQRGLQELFSAVGISLCSRAHIVGAERHRAGGTAHGKWDCAELKKVPELLGEKWICQDGPRKCG